MNSNSWSTWFADWVTQNNSKKRDKQIKIGEIRSTRPPFMTHILISSIPKPPHPPSSPLSPSSTLPPSSSPASLTYLLPSSIFISLYFSSYLHLLNQHHFNTFSFQLTSSFSSASSPSQASSINSPSLSSFLPSIFISFPSIS